MAHLRASHRIPDPQWRPEGAPLKNAICRVGKRIGDFKWALSEFISKKKGSRKDSSKLKFSWLLKSNDTSAHPTSLHLHMGSHITTPKLDHCQMIPEPRKINVPNPYPLELITTENPPALLEIKPRHPPFGDHRSHQTFVDIGNLGG